MLRFKKKSDKKRWLQFRDSGTSGDKACERITLLNAVSMKVAGRGIVVTSWRRDDSTFHSTGEAFDARRLSEANRVDPHPYTQEQVEEIEERGLALGIPIVVIAPGKKSEHWHIGPVSLK